MGVVIKAATSGGLKLQCIAIATFSSLSIHRSQQPRGWQPSNVFRRSGCRWSFINWPRDLAHTLLIFTVCQKVRNLASFSTLHSFWIRMRQKRLRSRMEAKLCAFNSPPCKIRERWSKCLSRLQVQLRTRPLISNILFVKGRCACWSIKHNFRASVSWGATLQYLIFRVGKHRPTPNLGLSYDYHTGFTF